MFALKKNLVKYAIFCLILKLKNIKEVETANIFVDYMKSSISINKN